MNFSSKKKSPSSSKKNGKKEMKAKRPKPSRSERTSAPLALTRSMRTGVPQVSGSPYSSDGRVRIRHREYIQDVAGSVAFASTPLPVNPGISSIFPWLSVMARQFESYLFRSLKFEYETQKSASTSGSVMLALDFDAADAPPATKQALMSYHNAVRAAVWAECCYSSDKGDLQKFGVQRYIRSGSLAANLDIKTYDVGNLILATQGEADDSVIGELYVEYDVELITPQLSEIPIATATAAYALNHCVPVDADLFASGVPDPQNTSTISRVGNLFSFSEAGIYLASYFLAGDAPVGHGGTPSAGSTVLGGQDAIGSGEICKVIQLSMLAGGTYLFEDTIGTGTEGFIILSLLPSGFGAISA